MSNKKIGAAGIRTTDYSSCKADVLTIELLRHTFFFALSILLFIKQTILTNFFFIHWFAQSDTYTCVQHTRERKFHTPNKTEP